MRFLDQKRETVAAVPELPAQFVDVSVELGAVGFFAVVHEPPRTRRIVEIENRRLREERRCLADDAGCSGLPSILIGRPSMVVATSGIAPVRRGIAVA